MVFSFFHCFRYGIYFGYAYAAPNHYNFPIFSYLSRMPERAHGMLTQSAFPSPVVSL